MVQRGKDKNKNETKQKTREEISQTNKISSVIPF